MLDELLKPGLLLAILITYLMPKLTPYIDRGISFLKGFLTQALKNYFRGRKLKTYKALKNNRRNMGAIHYEIAKANSSYILFVAFIAIYIFSIMGPLRSFLEGGIWVSLLPAIPVFVFEAVWLTADAKAKQLVAHAEKVRKRKIKVSASLI